MIVIIALIILTFLMRSSLTRSQPIIIGPDYWQELTKELLEEEAWNILKPICRELDELKNEGHMKFLSGLHNEIDGTYKINLRSNHLHFASRGLKDSIGDISYETGRIRIGMRANGIPVNIFVELFWYGVLYYFLSYTLVGIMNYHP